MEILARLAVTALAFATMAASALIHRTWAYVVCYGAGMLMLAIAAVWKDEPPTDPTK